MLWQYLKAEKCQPNDASSDSRLCCSQTESTPLLEYKKNPHRNKLILILIFIPVLSPSLTSSLYLSLPPGRSLVYQEFSSWTSVIRILCWFCDTKGNDFLSPLRIHNGFVRGSVWATSYQIQQGPLGGVGTD